MKLNFMKFLAIVLFFYLICCEQIEKNNPVSNNNLRIQEGNSIEVKIKDSDTLKLKLILIPPDSGYWILDNDTIHLDSLER